MGWETQTPENFNELRPVTPRLSMLGSMTRVLCAGLVLCAAFVAGPKATAGSDPTLVLDLLDPIYSGGKAYIGVQGTYTAPDAGPEVGADLVLLNLSLINSDAILSASQTDFSRFSFLPSSTNPYDQWTVTDFGFGSPANAGMLFDNTFYTVPGVSSGTDLLFGSIEVDLSGLPAGSFDVSINASGLSSPNLNTFAAINIQPIRTGSGPFENDVAFAPTFGSSEGVVTITTTTVIPSPMAAGAGVLGLTMLLAMRRCRGCDVSNPI